MEEDVVVFPSHIHEAHLPEELVAFFSDNGISISSSSFPMSCLRNLYRTDNDKFRRIKYFLEVFGFNFFSAKDSSYFVPAIRTPVHVVEGVIRGNFYPIEINELGLADFVRYVGSSKRDCVLGVVVERLTNQTDFFLKYFEIEGYTVNARSLYGDMSTKDEQNESVPRTEVDDRTLAEDAPRTPELSGGQKNELRVANSIEGFSVPYFCLRFFTEIISGGPEIQKAYIDSGFVSFGDLMRIEAKDIPMLVMAFSKATSNNYRSGIAEENLISFCQSREIFELTYGCDDLMSTFIYSQNRRFAEEDVISFPLAQNDPLRFSFSSPLFELSQINNQTKEYLSAFGVSDLSILSSQILSVRLDSITFAPEFRWCRLLFRPFVVFEEVLSELGIHQVHNPFLYDEEIRLLNINKAFSEYHKKLESLKDEYLEVLSLRENGIKLEEIGAMKGGSKQWIRQIITKCELRIALDASKTINYLLKTREYVPLEVFQYHLGLVTIIESRNRGSQFILDEELGVVLSKDNQKTILALKEKYRTHSGRIGCSDINRDFIETGICLYGWLTGESEHLEYDPYPVFIPKLANLNKIGADYLRTKGMQGYHVNDDKDEAVCFFEHHSPGSTSVGYRAISNDIMRSGSVLRGMSRYVSLDLVKPEQIKAVGLVINGESFGPYGLTAQALFDAHFDLLKLNGVDNPYFVYGIASTFFKNGFSYSGRGLRIFRGKALSLNEMAQAYLHENGRPFVKEVDFRQALGLGPTALEQCSIITKFDKSTIILKSWFTIREEDYQNLDSVITNIIEDHGYCHCSEIISSKLFFDQSKNAFLHLNRLHTPTRIAYFFDVMCEVLDIHKYHISHHCDCISLAEEPVETKVDLLKKYFRGKIFTKKQAEELLHSYKLTGTISGNDFYKGWAFFIDGNRLMLKDDFSLPVSEVEEASNALLKRFGEDVFVTAKQAVALLKIKGIANKLTEYEIGAASILTSNDISQWASPQNDLGVPSNHPLELLANKSLFESKIPLYSEVIKMYVFKEVPGKFITYDEVVKLLKESELIDFQLAFSSFQQIFKGHVEGQLLEVPK